MLSFSPAEPSLAVAAVSRKARVYAAVAGGEHGSSALLPIDSSTETLRHVVGARRLA